MSAIASEVRFALPRFVAAFRDRRGKMRYRFRRMGFDAYFHSEPGTDDFQAEYERFLISEKTEKAPTRPLPIISLLRQLGPVEPGAEYVYFVEAENGLVKIGHTKNIRERFKKLHTSAAGQLTLLGLACGDRALEQRLHALFADRRVTGEWFLPSPELRELAGAKRGQNV